MRQTVWAKPKLRYQNGKWHCILPTKHAWSWYVGNGNTILEAWNTYEQAMRIATMMDCTRQADGKIRK